MIKDLPVPLEALLSRDAVATSSKSFLPELQRQQARVVDFLHLARKNPAAGPGSGVRSWSPAWLLPWQLASISAQQPSCKWVSEPGEVAAIFKGSSNGISKTSARTCCRVDVPNSTGKRRGAFEQKRLLG